MTKRKIDRAEASRVIWSGLEDWCREKIQSLIQELLEEEVDEEVGRGRYERRRPCSQRVYRNGRGKRRRLTTGSGTIELRRPRVRGLAQPFESRVLPLFVKRTRRINALLPQLYLHGLAEGDFDLALRGLLGDEAPVSAGVIARAKAQWQEEYRAWSRRPLGGRAAVYWWADGLYVKAGLEDEKAAMLVVVAAFADGHKEIVALHSGYRESADSWLEVLRDVKGRGLNAPSVVVADGALGLWAALREVYPTAQEQRCWNHKIVNVLDKLPVKVQSAACEWLKSMMYAETQADCERRRDEFMDWCRHHQWDRAAETLVRDWNRLVTYYRLPAEHWVHLRTSNPAESPFAAVRLRTDAAKRFKRVDNATAAIWKLLMVGQQRFGSITMPELLPLVLAGVQFPDGKPAEEPQPPPTAQNTTAPERLHTY